MTVQIRGHTDRKVVSNMSMAIVELVSDVFDMEHNSFISTRSKDTVEIEVYYPNAPDMEDIRWVMDEYDVKEIGGHFNEVVSDGEVVDENDSEWFIIFESNKVPTEGILDDIWAITGVSATGLPISKEGIKQVDVGMSVTGPEMKEIEANFNVVDTNVRVFNGSAKYILDIEKPK